MMNRNYNRVSEGFLLTDLYQLTMAQLYFKNGIHENPAQFDHFFRSYPNYGNHKSGYCINAGLEWFINWIRNARFGKKEIECLKSHRNGQNQPIFQDDFLDYLKDNGHFNALDIQAIPEGRVIHPNVPITIVRGPLIMAQVVESALLNHLNFQTLVATKAARIKQSGRGQPVLEFGLRRAQAMGVNAGVRGALIGGADFSSNVGISCELGFPAKGTHAHSMVQVYMAMGEGELGAFKAYADLYPDSCLLLVDTINTLESGVPNAIKVFEELKKKGYEPVGIRLDSGDLAYLSIQAAKMLNEAGFPNTRIVLSNQLDELVLWQIISQIEDEAPKYGLDADNLINRLMFGVGTRLITSTGDPALDGVYKLVAFKKDQDWTPALKVSESREKIPNPGAKKVWRIHDKRNKASTDLLGMDDEEISKIETLEIHHSYDETKHRTVKIRDIHSVEILHEDIVKNARLVYEFPSIDGIRHQRDMDLDRLDDGVKRIMNPHIYHVSLTHKLWNLKNKLIKKAQ